jgi:diguanylate cyclase (GGDEF)-like protein/PAS domain S-box-containing protein
MNPSDDIAQWRVRVFSTLLPIVLALGTTAALPSIAVALRQGMWQIALMDVLALAWIFAIWRLERVRYTVRVLNFLAVLFMVAIGLMLAVGPVSLNYLMAPPIMAMILLGTLPGVVTLALGALCIVLFGVNGYARLYVPGLEADPLVASLLVAVNFSCVGALITFTAGTLIKGLALSLFEARTAAASLEAGQARLHALNAELSLTSEAVARLNDMVLIARMVDLPDAEQPIIFANDAFLRHTGYTREEVVGRSVRILQGPNTDPATVASIVSAVARKQPITTEMVNYTKRGEPYWVEVEMVPFASDSGAITHWVMVGRDVTERRNAADAIHRLAFYDVLTGLPNRRLLMDRLAQMVAAAQGGQALGAVLYVDLDNFKTVNDARGHAVGDQLLRYAAERLVAVVGAAGSVARLGGDEFVVLLGELGLDAGAATGRALALAEEIRCALADKIMIEGQRYYATTSIGVALTARAPQHDTVHDLLREADTAMYHAKARGRNGVALFEAGMLLDAERRLTLERDLAHALENGELALHLQLQVDAAHRPCGAELLMRWRRKDGSSVPPDVFIPVAESSGLIVVRGDWALRQACQTWHALAHAGHPLPLSVNVSPVQFRQPDFVARVEAILHQTGVPPGQLIFEVTEGLLVENLDQTIGRMHELAALGIRISVDDFGTGYSSLAYLTRMPLYELKIDKSFIRDTPHDKNGTAIVQSILAMAGHLGLRVVAEGVETAAQAEYLAAHGNACMQGYLFHRPMALGELLAQLRAAS